MTTWIIWRTYWRCASWNWSSENVALANDARTALVAEMDTEAYEPRPDDAPPGTPFFRQLKELTLSGYYTSEVGATQELQWIEAPGRYDADVPLSEVGRAWA